MIAANNWSVTETQAGNKWDSMLTTYKDTKNWTNETGQGVKESDGQAKFQGKGNTYKARDRLLNLRFYYC